MLAQEKGKGVQAALREFHHSKLVIASAGHAS
jgi:hypothetical protein